ncbi:hypothetical protein CW354_20370 [Marinicaulis flavus]|uniref:Uncharacterized protein n=1 Tax=Hyphococcus luteus TaxID=2058213 RepID=A0A2S7K034_9PROT|nr:hypothetical protein CW354_20370 [Marinicaulis flavus]
MIGWIAGSHVETQTLNQELRHLPDPFPRYPLRKRGAANEARGRFCKSYPGITFWSRRLRHGAGENLSRDNMSGATLRL